LKDNKSDFMELARKRFLASVDAWRENHDLALDDINFSVLGEQWDEKIKKEREDEDRPCITINKFPAHIRQVVNDARQNKPAIRFRPVDDNSDPETAEVLNGLVRNIETSSNSDIAYDTAISQTVSGGFGYIRVNVDFTSNDTFEKDILIERIPNQFSVFPDASAMSADGSDWKYCFVTERISKNEFTEKYGNKDVIDFESEYNKEFEWETEDGVWIAEYWVVDDEVKQICLLSDGDVVDEDVYDDLAEYYQAIGVQKVDSRQTNSKKVTQYIISGKEVLETNNWDGDLLPIIPVYGEEVIVENKRYFKSLCRDSKDAQRLLNYWRSCTTELVALAPKTPFVGSEDAFEVDTEKWASANSKNYAYIAHKKGTQAPQRQPFASVPSGAMQESLNADDDIKSTMGMFGASIGQQDNATSGKAIMARQRESDTGTFHYIDNLSRSLRQVGRVILELIPHVYHPGRVLRIVGEDGKETENIQVGQRPEQQDENDISNIYDISTGKYDVVVDVGPGYTTKRQEAANQMIEFSRVNPQASSLISDLIAKNLDWPGAEEISDRFKAMLPPQITGDDPQIQQLQQQLQQAQQQTQQIAGQLQQQLEQLKQDKTIEVEKVKIDAYNAETNRLKTMQTGMTSEDVQMLVMQTVQQLMQTPDITPGAEQQQMQQPETQQQGAIQ
jgi:hypothetical protein